MIIESILTALSIFVTSISLVSRDPIQKLNKYKYKGKNYRQAGKLAKSVAYYKKALDYARAKDEKLDIWKFVMYTHTDRVIATAQEMYDDTDDVDMFQNWKWGPTNIPTDYNRPIRKETLK